MIMALLARKALGAPVWLWCVIAIFLIFAVGLFWASRTEQADDRQNQEIGATVEREHAQDAALEQVETGNVARTEIEADVSRGGGSVLYSQCLRTARTPANCDRYLLPQQQAADR